VTRKQRRMTLLGTGLVCFAAAVALVLVALEEQVTFFYAPGDLVAETLEPGIRIRLGGVVEDGSVQQAADGITTTFVVTDFIAQVPVAFTGVLPDLFREGQGVIATGRFDRDGLFTAEEVLARHDENYMPKEVADALKASGEWREDGEP